MNVNPNIVSEPTALSDGLAYTSAAELARRIRHRDLSPVEVVDASIARIEARNPSLNALVYLGFDEARREARAAEDAVMRGAELGPLHGVPAAIKDLFDFKPGWPATLGGIRALKDNVVDAHCAFADFAVLVGSGVAAGERREVPSSGGRGSLAPAITHLPRRHVVSGAGAPLTHVARTRPRAWGSPFV
jgi:amidase